MQDGSQKYEVMSHSIPQNNLNVFKKIGEVVNTVTSDLKRKIDPSCWNKGNFYTQKTSIDKLNQCIDEIDFQLQNMHISEIGYIIKKILNCFNIVNDQLVTFLDMNKQVATEMPLEYVGTYRNRLNQTHNKLIEIDQMKKSETQQSSNIDELIVANPVVTNSKTKCLFGGSTVIPVQSFVPYSKMVINYVTQIPQAQITPQMQEEINIEKYAEAQKRKKVCYKQVVSKGTDTNDDIRALLSTLYISEKQSELSQLQHDAEQNMLELNKMIKLKVLWETKEPSGVQTKIQELSLRFGKGGNQQDNWINEELKQFGLQENVEQNYSRIQDELKGNIEMVQNKTARKIIDLAELKIRGISEKRTMTKSVKQLNSKKANNFSRLEDLENIIIAKNLEIQKKQTQINNLYDNFETSEKKLQEFLDQIENYQRKIFHIENSKQYAIQHLINIQGQYDVSIQVHIPDPIIHEAQEKIQQFMLDNLKLKDIISQMKDVAQEEKQNTAQPSSIVEAIVMIISSDLTTEHKIEGVKELLIYVRGRTAEELTKTTAKEMYQWITIKLEQSIRNKDSQFDFMYGENSDELQQFERLKKLFSARKPNQKHSKKYNDNENSGGSPSNKKKKKDFLNHPENPFQKGNPQQNIRKSISGQAIADQLVRQQSQRSIMSQKTIQRSQKNIMISQKNIAISQKSMKKVHSLELRDDSVVQQQMKETEHIQMETSLKTQTSYQSEQGDVMDSSKVLQGASTTTGKQKKPKQRLSLLKLIGTPRKQDSKSPKSKRSQKGQNTKRSKSPKSKRSSQSPKSKRMSQNVELKSPVETNNRRQTSPNIMIFKSKNTQKISLQIDTNLMIPSQKNIDSRGSDQQYPTSNSTRKQSKFNQDSQIQFFQNNQSSKTNKSNETNITPMTQNQKNSQIDIMPNRSSFLSQSNKNQSQRMDKINEYNILQKGTSIYEQIDGEDEAKGEVAQEKSSFLSETQNKQLISSRDQVSDILSKDSFRDRVVQLEQINESEQVSQDDIMLPKFDKKIIVSKKIGTHSVATQTDYAMFQDFIMETLKGIKLNESQLKSFQDQLKVSFGSEAPTSITRSTSVLYSSNQSLRSKLHQKTNSTSNQQRILGEMLQKNQTTYVQKPEIIQQQFELKLEQMDELDFEQEALRENLGEPFEIVGDNELMNEVIVKKLYSGFVSRKASPWKAELTLKIVKYHNLPQFEQITYNFFSKYYQALLINHKQCGEHCIHLKRFLNRLGYITRFYSKRRILHPFKSEPIPFKIDPKTSTSTSNTNTQRFNEKNNSKYYY